MASNDKGESTQLRLLKLNDSKGNLFEIEETSGSFTESLPRHRRRTYSFWSPNEEGATLAWNDLSVYTKTRKNSATMCKRIVNGVSGAVKAGSLVAIMGASGAGKSTFMSTLAYRNAGGTYVDGDILINGRPLGNYMKYLSGFMHQEDIFVGSLTVYEHMNIMAHLKLDRRISSDEKNSKIFEILKHLGLTKCMGTRIGREGESKVLSGGEKKRLAFATELLTDPTILFCDEPTTGLDSYSAQKLVTIMNSMASNGKTILCTIHQPSSDIFAMFSQLILMADGKIAFMGSAANAINFFYSLGYKCPSSYNPADFFIKTLATTRGCEESSKQTIKRICNHFAVSDYYKEVDVVVQYEFHMGRAVKQKTYIIRNNFKENFWWTKLYWLTYRWFLEILRNPGIQTIRLIQKIVIALMIGLCYLGTEISTQSGIQSIQGAVFMLVTENTFAAMYSVLGDFPHNHSLFLREYKSGLYPTAAYYVSRILSMLPGLIIEPIIFVVIVYWLSGLRQSGYAFFITILASILTMNVATACGVFFSNAFDSVPSAMAYIVPFDYVLMVTSGIFVKLNALPTFVSWTKYLSWLMYSTESMTIVQWEGITNITCNSKNQEIPCLMAGTQVLEKYSFSEDNLLRDLWSMLGLYTIFHLLGFFCLWYKTRQK